MDAELRQSLDYLREPVKRCYVEDVMIRVGNHVTYQSFEVDFGRDADGGVMVRCVKELNSGKQISTQPWFDELLGEYIAEEIL